MSINPFGLKLKVWSWKDVKHRFDSTCSSNTFSALNALANQKPNIDYAVDGDDHTSKYELDLPGQAGRIDDRQEIMFNETLRIARLTRLDPEIVLKICERTTAAGEFDKYRPCGNRYMHERNPVPPKRHCGTQNGEQDEGQMEYKDKVGCQTECHALDDG